MRYLLSMLVLLGAALPALAQEALLIGRVESVTLKPSGADDCPKPCPATATTDASRMTHVCVSNMGGCQKILFRIERVLLGDERLGLKTYERRTGEWGTLVFPVKHEPILVHIDGDRIRWTSLFERKPGLSFEAKPFSLETISGVSVASLPPDSNGEIPLAELTGRLPRTR